MLKLKVYKLVCCCLVFGGHFKAIAQCAMCRAVLENEDGKNAAKGINDGIEYLMVLPYLLVGGIIIIIYRKYRTLK